MKSLSCLFFFVLVCGCSPFNPAAFQRPAPPADAGQVALEILRQVPILMAVKGVMRTSERTSYVMAEKKTEKRGKCEEKNTEELSLDW